mmetsp:Transcript_7180/g.7280  ORF Transcript_7180/g.7280 Transcript_7180/m.7280 type:complete len:240 (-) Transcript_7180:50-769(-)
MSPERLLGEPYDSSGDVWSVGIMMVQLWLKRYPFEDNISSPIDLLTELEGIQLDKVLKGFPPLMADMIRNMLVQNAENRFTCISLLESPWFQDMGVGDIRDAQQTVEVWLRRQQSCKQEEIDFNKSAIHVLKKDHVKIQSKYNEEKYDDHKENEFPNKENNIEKIFNKSSYHRNIVSDNNLKKRLSTSSSVYEDDFEDYEDKCSDDGKRYSVGSRFDDSRRHSGRSDDARRFSGARSKK